jgi:hypothetical protein
MATHLNIVEEENTQTGSANSETILTEGYGVSYYDCGGTSRTGVILEAGDEDGQQVVVVNASDANETITFAEVGTSNVAGGSGNSIAQNKCHLFVWSDSLSKWLPHA